MANHKSALKRSRQNIKRRLRNRNLRSSYKTEIKKFLTMITDQKIEDAQKFLSDIHKTIDKAHSKGVIPKNTAARYKSNLTIRLNKAVNQT